MTLCRYEDYNNIVLVGMMLNYAGEAGNHC